MEISVVKYTGPFQVHTDFALSIVGGSKGGADLEIIFYRVNDMKKIDTAFGEYPRCYALFRDLYSKVGHEMLPEKSITIFLDGVSQDFYHDVIRAALHSFGRPFLKQIILLTVESEEAEKTLITTLVEEENE